MNVDCMITIFVAKYNSFHTENVQKQIVNNLINNDSKLSISTFNSK